MTRRFSYSLLLAGLIVAVIATWTTLQAQPRDTPSYTSRHLSPEQIRQLREGGDILSLEAIISLVRKNKSDRLLEVELLEKNDILFYKVEILEQSGIVKKYFLDPRTGTPPSAGHPKT